MKKILIVPDMHLRFKIVEFIIQKEIFDQIIFLGDYFDDFNDTEQMVEEEADWLLDSLNQPNRIHLLGNHDIAYYAEYDWGDFNTAINNNIFQPYYGHKYYCTGFEYYKKIIIQEKLQEKDWNKFKLYHWITDNTLCTHAGFTNQLYTEYYNINKKYHDIHFLLKNEANIALKNIKKGKHPNKLISAGISRGGKELVGGITWCDYFKDFTPINNINQIFGHTILSYPELKYDKNNNFNLALDTNNKYYALYQPPCKINLYKTNL